MYLGPNGPGDIDPAAYYGPLFNFVEEISAVSDAPGPAIALNALVQFAARFGGVALLPRMGTFETVRLYGLLVGPLHDGRKTTSGQMVANVFDAAAMFSTSFVALANAPPPAAELQQPYSGEQITRATFSTAGSGNRLLLRLDDAQEFRAIAERSGNTAAASIRRGFNGKAREPGTYARIREDDAGLCVLLEATPRDLTDERTTRVLGPETLGNFLPAFTRRNGRPFKRFIGLPDLRRDYLARLVLANVAALELDGVRFPLVIAPNALVAWEGLADVVEGYPFASAGAQPHTHHLGVILQRLAGLLALMNGERVITPEAITAAHAWGDYALRTLDYVHGTAEEMRRRQQAEALAVRMLRRVQKGPPEGFQYVALSRWARRKGDVTADAVAEAVDLLKHRGLIEDSSRRAPGGRHPIRSIRIAREVPHF